MFAWQERLAVPDPLILVGLGELQDNPDGTESVIVIVLVNPFRDTRVIVEIADDPGATGAGDDALIPKSWKLNIVVAVCVMLPLVPVIVRA